MRDLNPSILWIRLPHLVLFSGYVVVPLSVVCFLCERPAGMDMNYVLRIFQTFMTRFASQSPLPLSTAHSNSTSGVSSESLLFIWILSDHHDIRSLGFESSQSRLPC